MTTVDATIGQLVQQTVVNFAGSGDNVIILGQSGRMIKILQFFLTFGGATNITYKSQATPISGPLTFIAAGSHVLDYFQLPLTCNPGDSFVINSSNAVQVSGTVWYAVIQ